MSTSLGKTTDGTVTNQLQNIKMILHHHHNPESPFRQICCVLHNRHMQVVVFFFSLSIRKQVVYIAYMQHFENTCNVK